MFFQEKEQVHINPSGINLWKGKPICHLVSLSIIQHMKNKILGINVRNLKLTHNLKLLSFKKQINHILNDFIY